MTDGRKEGLAMRHGVMRAKETGALCFVAMAQAEQFDDATILENADLFAIWPDIGGIECPQGTILWDLGGLYRAMHGIGAAHREMRPSASPTLWQPIGNPGEEWPEWSQWIGVGDLYQEGAKVRSGDHANASDEAVYRWVSTVGDNVWRPGEYGWEKAGVHE